MVERYDELTIMGISNCVCLANENALFSSPFCYASTSYEVSIVPIAGTAVTAVTVAKTDR